MKEFDLEQLKRQNVFTHREPDFEAMQQQVLASVAPRRSYRMNWVYAAAAAVAMIFGFTFLSGPETDMQSVTTDSRIAVQKAAPAAIISQPTEEAVALEILEEDLTSVAAQHPNHRTAQTNEHTSRTAAATTSQSVKARNADLQMEQILADFSRAELADVSQNAEQDIYLDLYN